MDDRFGLEVADVGDVDGEALIAALEGIERRADALARRAERVDNLAGEACGELNEAAGEMDSADGEVGAFGKGRDRHRRASEKLRSGKGKSQSAKQESQDLRRDVEAHSADLKAIKSKLSGVLKARAGRNAAFLESQIQTLTVISNTMSLVNSGAAAAQASIQFALPRDTFVKNIRLTVIIAPGAASTSLATRMTSLQLNSAENLVAGFNNATVTNVSGATVSTTAGILLPVATGIPLSHTVPVNRKLSSSDPVTIAFTNLSAVLADGVVIGIEITTLTQNQQIVMTT